MQIRSALYILLLAFAVPLSFASCQKTTPPKPKLPKRNCNKVVNVAHRGASGTAPENTLAAAGRGLIAGADTWELDVHPTADGRIIVHHDHVVNVHSNTAQGLPFLADAQTSAFTLVDLQKLDFGSQFVTNDKQNKVRQGLLPYSQMHVYVGETAPSLTEALQFTKRHNWQVIVELKEQNPLSNEKQFIQNVLKTIQKAQLGNRVRIWSFQPKYLKWVKELAPNIPTGLLLFFLRPKKLPLLRALQVQSISVEHSGLPVEAIPVIKTMGIKIFVWSINRTSRMHRYIQLGVDGIVTDFPGKLAKILSQCRANQ